MDPNQLVIDSDDDDEPPVLVDFVPPPPTTTTTEDATAGEDSSAPELVPTLAETSKAKKDTVPLPPCPVTILSGFLGSGKTTLIQYILKSPDHGKRIAVIENEFGDGLAVESLIARDGVEDNNNNNQSSLQDLIELPNGCICCTVKDSLVATLENLLEKRQDLDYILIEASGMANPGPIASVFWLDDALESRLQLDGICTIVDSHHILEQLHITEEAAQQIAYADRLLVNKVDLLKDDAALNKVKTVLRKLHPTAPMQMTTFSQIPNLDWILNANCFGGADRVEELDAFWCQPVANEESQSNVPLNHSHNHAVGEACDTCDAVTANEHRHTAKVSTLAFQNEGSISLSKLNKWLADILWPNQDAEDKVLTAILHKTMENDKKNPNDNTIDQTGIELPKPDGHTQIFRIKGIMSVRINQDEDVLEEAEITKYIDPVTKVDNRRYIVQAVHDLWEVHPASDDLQWEKGEARISKIVVIGKHLNKETLERGYLNCFA